MANFLYGFHEFDTEFGPVNFWNSDGRQVSERVCPRNPATENAVET